MSKKKKLLFICISVFLFTACSEEDQLSDMIDFAEERYEEEQKAEVENPLAGMDKNEKVLYILHETYPDHSFTAIDPVTDSTDSGIYADENGLEFEVDRIYEISSYQIGMYDDYIYKTLMEQDFLNKAIEVAEKYGYELEFDDYHKSISFKVNMSNTSYEQILTTVKEILTLPTYVPESNFTGTGSGFSTGEINYYTVASMEGVSVDLILDEAIGYSSDALLYFPFNYVEEYQDEQLIDYIEQAYYVMYQFSSLDIAYKLDAILDLDNEIIDVESIDADTEEIVRSNMAYNIPKVFEVDSSPFGSGVTYYHPEKVELIFNDKISAKLNTIEVSYAMHDYDLSEKQMFLQAMEKDIKSQIGNRSDVKFVSIEEYPDSEHTVIKVQLNEPFGAISKHYYIMGDRMFALVEQTTFSEEEYYDEVTVKLIKSFKWE